MFHIQYDGIALPTIAMTKATDVMTPTALMPHNATRQKVLILICSTNDHAGAVWSPRSRRGSVEERSSCWARTSCSVCRGWCLRSPGCARTDGRKEQLPMSSAISRVMRLIGALPLLKLSIMTRDVTLSEATPRTALSFIQCLRHARSPASCARHSAVC